jgi:hypothetical protein
MEKRLLQIPEGVHAEPEFDATTLREWPAMNFPNIPGVHVEVKADGEWHIYELGGEG